MTLTIHEDTQVRVIVDKTVKSYREAETIARAFAAHRSGGAFLVTTLEVSVKFMYGK